MLDTANTLFDLALQERQRWQLSSDLRLPFFEAMEAWRRDDNTRRLWERDASLWTGHDEANWLGWLTVAEDQLADLDGLLRAVEDIEEAGFKDILVLGMGGSCLFPEVLSLTFGRVPLYPQLLVLDSTDPEQIQRFASKLDLRKTLFIVSSKSGETLETSILKDFFYEEKRKDAGATQAGSHFVAITDPGSKLQQAAETQHFRHVFAGVESISGRFSALSNFGMVPAAAMGLDLGTLLVRTLEMVHACVPDIPVELNPGVQLGLILGVAGDHGRDKVTVVVSPGVSALGEWIEQLLAESTGKAAKGLIPIAEEELGDVSDYPEDRLFCYIRDKGVADPMQDARIDALEKAGHPVVRIDFRDKYDLGQEIFRWEIAVATAGSVMSINPFNQP